jgi:hypothetical protein
MRERKLSSGTTRLGILKQQTNKQKKGVRKAGVKQGLGVSSSTLRSFNQANNRTGLKRCEGLGTFPTVPSRAQKQTRDRQNKQ